MKKIKVIVQNEEGIHARPASVLIDTAKNFKSNIHMVKKNQSYNCKSIMMVLSSGAGKGEELELTFDGEDEDEALKTIVSLFESRFGEQ